MKVIDGKKIFCVVCSLILLLVNFNIVSADNNAISLNQSLNTQSAKESGLTSYISYMENNQNNTNLSDTITVFEAKDFNIKSGDVFSWGFFVANDSLFQIKLEYCLEEKKDLDLSVEIDRKYPFEESKNIIFPAYWENNGENRTDNSGNEFAPEQALSDKFVWEYCRNYSGEIEKPYLFYASAGNHEIKITVNQGKGKISKILLVPEENAEKYETKNDIDNKVNELITIEGEGAVLKSSASLIPLSDDSSADVNPSSPKIAKINYIGGPNWSEQNDTLIWDFSVKKSGYYRLGFMYRQDEVLGGVSYRHLKIDGKTPFLQAAHIKFKYTNSWNYYEYSDRNNPYWIYLEKGEHQLSLSVTAGEFTEIYRQLKEVTSLIGDIYIDITMVVGESVDVSRSYELFNQIPQFNERLKEAIDSLGSISSQLQKLQENKSSSNVSNINNAIETLTKMYENPYSAHKYKSAYYSAYTNLSALLGTLTDMPLDIDRIFFIGNGHKFENPKVGVMNSLSFGIQRFINSFIKDYDITEAASDEELTIWVNWGRDQTQVLDALINTEFSAKENIPVNLRLVNATFIQALLAGSGPDVLLHMSRTEPVNLAMRGALVDLTQFDDCEDVLKNFSENSELPYRYKDGLYALPDLSNFYLMFVRTDIFTEMGLSIPQTWQDFIYTMTILQHSNLQVSLPYTQITDSTTVNVGVGGLSLYPTLLIQNGLSLYNEESKISTLTQESQIKTFDEWTKFYTKYKVPVTMDFYNRFRIGTAPLGIANYTLYTQLKAAAPEIENRWTVALIPGTEQSDGTINHSCAGSGSGCAITKISKNPENAWKFLKWWISAETQLMYSDNIESILGPLGRVATSNTQALNSMIWDEEMSAVLNEQKQYVVEIPEIPGGYYTARGIDQAFWNVVEQNAIPTDMMLEWGAIVDGEIKRKHKEYS